MKIIEHLKKAQGKTLFSFEILLPKKGENIFKWWEQICMFSSRDQISFSFCLWSLSIKPAIMPGFVNGINPKTGMIGNNDLIPQTRIHADSIR